MHPITAQSPAPATPPAPYHQPLSAHKTVAQAHKKALAELYLAVLEAEYLTADQRRRFYPREERGQHRRVCTLKRERITLVCERDGLVSMFDDAKRMAETRAKLQLDGPGLPSFHYKDFTDRQRFEARDLAHYFTAEQQVALTLDTDQAPQVGRITTFDYAAGLVRVLLAGQREAQPFPMAQVRRTFR